MSASTLKLIHEARWQMVTRDTDSDSVSDVDSDKSYSGSEDGSRPSSPTDETSSPLIELMTPEGVTLSLHVGGIASQQVDVIVNSTDSSLDLNHGALSTSILEAGGTILRDECKKNAPDGIKCGEVVVTSGGQLPCQYVIHGLACSWDDGQCKKVLGQLVANSLLEAKKKNVASMAIPALGAGGLGIPPAVCAEVMFDEVCEFCRLNPDTKLKDVRFVVYPEAEETLRAFGKLLLNRCYGVTVETTEGVTLSLCVSNLAVEQVDVIVNTINAQLQLDGGEVSNALLDIAGETLQEECDTIAPDGIELGEVVVTSGGQLECQHVVHGACCGWNAGEETCTEILGKFLTNCFNVVHEKKLKSMAIPAIGTGGLGIPPEFVAKVMIEELLKFSHKNPKTTLEDVRFIVYCLNRPAIQAFNEVFRGSCSVLPDATPPQEPTVKGSLPNPLALPTCWTALTSKQFYKLDELHKASSEYQIVENMFKPGDEWEIIKIERVQNAKLYRQFMVQKKDMEDKSKHPGTVERRVWHGTSETAAIGVSTYGFNRSYSYCDINGSVYGYGTYFAEERSYSSDDGYSRPDDQGLKRMFLARVLVGVYTKGNSDVKVPPERPGMPNVLFDSVVDDVSSPTIFVVFNDCQAYPEYLITFK